MTATALLATLFAVLAQTAPQPQQPEQPPSTPGAGQQALEKLPPRQPRGEPVEVQSSAPDRAWIGVTLQAEGAEPDAQDHAGLAVVQVLPGSPAAKAGLEGGDRMIAVEGKPLASYDALARLLREHVPGNRLRLEIRREVGVAPQRADSGRPRLGVVLGAAQEGRGVEITEVVADSPAARAGLRERDRILAVGDREVSSREDVVAALDELASSLTIELAIARELEVTLGRMPEGLSGRPEEGAFGLPGLTPPPQPDWPFRRELGMPQAGLEELRSELRALSEEVRSLRALIEELRAEVARLRR